ncbi:MAG: hypothetical protein RLZ80_676 [Actinomycetota bacterium]|jgi:hypothetical protein
MKVYTVVDSREPDRYEAFILFLNRENAEIQRKSMGNESIFFDVHEVEVIE